MRSSFEATFIHVWFSCELYLCGCFYLGIGQPGANVEVADVDQQELNSVESVRPPFPTSSQPVAASLARLLFSIGAYASRP